jgi:hypothetical protein
MNQTRNDDRNSSPEDADGSIGASFLPEAVRFQWRKWTVRGLAGIVLTVSALGCVHRFAAKSDSQPLPNLPVATAGGNQLWTDVAWDDGWRVQTHVWTGHARLLDEGNVRRTWGSREKCEAQLAARRTKGDARAPREKAVVLLHGLWRTRRAMSDLGAAFEAAGYDVIDIGYPSTRRSVAEHAAQVAELLNGLAGEDVELSFVTHSLGSLVVRDLLARKDDPWRAHHTPARAVFIAAPSSGAALANFAERIPGAFAVYGKPSREIASGLAAKLSAPTIPFATIAASRGTEDGWNPLIPGDDDGVVGVSETHLEGSAAHLTVKGTHTFVMEDGQVIGATLRFIDAGSFD